MRSKILLLVSTICMSISGCGISVESSSRQLMGVEVIAVSAPTTTNAVTPPESIAEKRNSAVIAYFIRGEGLLGQAVVVDSQYSATDLINFLIEGLALDDTASGLRSGLAQRADLIDEVLVESNIVRLKLSLQFNELPGIEQILVLGQITLTLVTNLKISGVEFFQNESVLVVPDARGQPISRPTTRSDYVELLLKS
ncbi:MAG: GerMN domain-containing protein [Ilumatobacteraceae bacterium]